MRLAALGPLALALACGAPEIPPESSTSLPRSIVVGAAPRADLDASTPSAEVADAPPPVLVEPSRSPTDASLPPDDRPPGILSYGGSETPPSSTCGGPGSGGARVDCVSVSGYLPRARVESVIKQNRARFEACYMAAPHRVEKTGTVDVKFVIDRQGAVSTSQDAGSRFPDPDVVACVVRSMSNMSFDPPVGGIVTVVYRFHFAPTIPLPR